MDRVERLKQADPWTNGATSQAESSAEKTLKRSGTKKKARDDVNDLQEGRGFINREAL
jgi:hypothetical protein